MEVAGKAKIPKAFAAGAVDISAGLTYKYAADTTLAAKAEFKGKDASRKAFFSYAQQVRAHWPHAARRATPPCVKQSACSCTLARCRPRSRSFHCARAPPSARVRRSVPPQVSPLAKITIGAEVNIAELAKDDHKLNVALALSA